MRRRCQGLDAKEAATRLMTDKAAPVQTATWRLLGYQLHNMKPRGPKRYIADCAKMPTTGKMLDALGSLAKSELK